MSFFLQLNTEEDIQKNVGNQMEAIDFHCNFISLLWKQIIIIIPYIYIVIFWALKALYIQGGISSTTTSQMAIVNCLVTNILQNIIFLWTHRGLEQLEAEKNITL